jgi:glycosyltransferase involved in cell wall biosynthesis
MTNSQRPPLRLAYISPLPPARSGIADYSQELLPELGQLAHITLYADQPAQVSGPLPAQFTIKSTADFPADRWQYDLTLYQMGNSQHHAAIYQLALDYPGIVVLHDHSLHHFVADCTVGQGDFPAYAREMGYALGPAGVHQAREIRLGHRPHPLFELPLNDRLVDRSLGLIVHSQYVADLIARRRPDRPLATIPALMSGRSGYSLRHELKLPAETVILASIGLVTASKRLDLALRAFARLRAELPHVHYLIVGESHPEVGLQALIQGLGLQEAVSQTGYVVELDEFIDWTATADVIINLRQPTTGETSAAALRAMAAGRPLIVFDHGWYSELPDRAAIKIPAGDEEALLSAMRQLVDRPAKRRKMGQFGQTYIARHHHPAQVAARYVDFLEQYLAGLGTLQDLSRGAHRG